MKTLLEMANNCLQCNDLNEGKSQDIHYTLDTNDYNVHKGNSFSTPMEWKVKELGKPTAENIEKFIQKYNESMVNGVNKHIGIKGTVYGGKIKDQKRGSIVATWENKDIAKKYTTNESVNEEMVNESKGKVKKLIVTIEMGNSAFEDETELSRIFKNLAEKMEKGNFSDSKIMDHNGNSVGTVVFK